MKLPPGSKFIDQVASVRDMAARLRSIAAEIEFGKAQTPDLLRSVTAAREDVEAIPPSQLVAFTDQVADGFTALRRAELVRDAVQVALARLESDQASLNSRLSRALAEAGAELQRLCVAAGMETNVLIAGIACRPTIAALEELNEFHGPLLERTEMLLRTCVELGLEVQS